jgi:hypothetical protein
MLGLREAVHELGLCFGAAAGGAARAALFFVSKLVPFI